MNDRTYFFFSVYCENMQCHSWLYKNGILNLTPTFVAKSRATNHLNIYSWFDWNLIIQRLELVSDKYFFATVIRKLKYFTRKYATIE